MSQALIELLNRYANNPGMEELAVPVRGHDVIRHPMLNKSTAFAAEERIALGLDGLLPYQKNSIEIQAQRSYESMVRKADPLERYIGLAGLQDRNEHLFYRVLVDHLEEFMPIVYTPTVGLAVQQFSHHFRRARGIWVTPAHRGRITEVLRNASRGLDVRLLVVTDNESVLGIGDQGAGGIAIAIGKLALYCACAGIHPVMALPVSLDVGTDNPTLLEDPLYLGWRNARLRGDDYEALVEEFVHAVHEVLPTAVVQWEDFRKNNALMILDRYRDVVPSFNDDIQGTGAMATAGVMSALRVTGTSVAEQRIVIHGAGAAGLGIARQLRAAQRAAGMTADAARQAIAVLDSRGLLVGQAVREVYKRELAWDETFESSLGLDAAHRDLLSVVRAFKPTVLIGTSGQPGAFNEAVVKAMHQHCPRPVILPLSNPTDYAEARPADLMAWTEGQALIATGSPFEPVQFGGKTHRIGQGNNVFVFPGLGLGALAAKANAITDGMISAAVMALAEAVTGEELAEGLLFPAISRLRPVSLLVALAVMDCAVAEGVADPSIAALDDKARQQHLDGMIWEPYYRRYSVG
ncbi:MAG: NAD-dependent malic enzyme [Gammaproteobacteria bacterium]